MAKWLRSLTGNIHASKLPFCSPMKAPHWPATVKGLPASACCLIVILPVKSLDASGNCGTGFSHSDDWASVFSEIPPINPASANKTPAYLAEYHTLVPKRRTRILKNLMGHYATQFSS